MPANPGRDILSWNRYECHWDRPTSPSGVRMDLEFCENQARLRRTLGAWHQSVGSRGWRCAGEPGNGWRHNDFRSSGPHNLRIVSGRACTFRQEGQRDRANVMKGGAVFCRSQPCMLEGRRQRRNRAFERGQAFFRDNRRSARSKAKTWRYRDTAFVLRAPNTTLLPAGTDRF